MIFSVKKIVSSSARGVERSDALSPCRESGRLQLGVARIPPNPRVQVVFRKDLTAHRGKLLSGLEQGSAVHAGTFLRENLIVLDRSLRKEPRELRRILLHELSHFTWWRLGNPARLSYERILAAEMEQGVPGELGWSAEWRKNKISPRDRAARTRRWREYCCESFCDTAAWLYSGIARHGEFTLPAAFRSARRRRLQAIIGEKEFPCP